MTPTKLEIHDGVATISLASVENRNALSDALVDSFVENWEFAERDPAVRVIMVTNEGKTFCAGADLKAVASAGRTGRQSDAFVAMLGRILDCRKPTVAKVMGGCFGGGVGLAAAFDISVASTDSKFGFTEVRLGAAPAIISVVVLSKVSRSNALELFMRGNTVSAQRACEVGLINYFVEAALVDSTVRAILDDLLLGAPNAMSASKELIRRVPKMARSDAFAWTAQLSADLFNGPEAAEGIAAFIAKRSPAWVETAH